MKSRGVVEIAVLIAPVHDCLNPVSIEPGGKGIIPSSLRWILNPCDGIALEQALRLRDVLPGAARVSVVTFAPSNSEKVIRECLAAGADEAIRIWDDRMEGSDPYATAAILAAALRSRTFGLILCGSRRADLEHGQVGPALAELLGLPQVTGARKVLPGQDRGHIHVHKRVPGYLTKLSCPLPALVAIEKGEVLRYPRHADRLRARKMDIPLLDMEAVGLSVDRVGGPGSVTELERLTPPKPTRRSAMASTAGTLSAAARLQRIMGGGVSQKKDTKIWECPDRESAQKVAEHMVKEKMVLF
jgi:electron transfer flavoprotein beta subunit